LNDPSTEKTIDKIASIIHNRPLASSLHESISSALKCPFVHIAGNKTVWAVFKQSLDAAIRDIERHPRGELFRRLIEYGSHHPDYPESKESNGKSTLSNSECGMCVQFIFSHMVNRFKGELAELLSLEPCLELVKKYQKKGILTGDIHLYFGNNIKQRRRIRNADGHSNTNWGSFTKGADGLLVEAWKSQNNNAKHKLNILGVIEVKSMSLSINKILAQINNHISRLNGGVRLGKMIWLPKQISFSGILNTIVVPSTWKLSKEWQSVKKEQGRMLVLPEPSKPPVGTCIEKVQPNLWKIQLSWSQEALNQAAYEMTFWYMSQVGKHIYTKKRLPKEWAEMTPEEAGYNSIKMMLYYFPLRYLSKRQERLAIKLYNIYSFGYPLGIDSKEMLWPEDFPNHLEKK
jgi:hypothetical protein